MKKLLTLLLLVFVTTWSSYGFVQTSYWFSSTSGAEYAFDLSQGTALGEGLLLDNQTFPNIKMPDGFKFKFDGVDYTTFAVSVNGSLQFYTPGDATDPSGMAVLSTAKNTVAAFNADLIAADASSKITYWVSGAAGDRTLTVQWYRFALNADLSFNPTVNFQIVLHEKGNVIEIIYGATQASLASAGVQVGLVGAATTDFLVRKDGSTPTTAWLNSVAGGANTDLFSYTTTIFPKASASNQSLHFFFTPNAPGVVKSPISPLDKATCVANPVTLTWTQTAQSATAGAADDQTLSWGTNSSALTDVTLAGNVTSYALPVLMPNTTYYWKVTPKNVFGSAAGTLYSFTTKNLPPAALSAANADINPDNGEINVVNIPAVILSWTAPAVSTTAGAAEMYKIYFNDNQGNLTLVKTQPETSFTITNLDTNKTYTWRVDAINTGCGGGTTTGAVWSFTTRNYAPAAPELVSPACGSLMVDRLPTFNWKASVVNLPVFTEAVKYTWYLSLDPNFVVAPGNDTRIVTDLDTLAWKVLFPLQWGQKYYWKVTATDVLGHVSPVSAPCSFTVTPGTGTLSGVVSGDIYWPIAQNLLVNGAVVTATPAVSGYPTVTTVSNPDGTYEFTDLYAVNYSVTAVHPDYNNPSVVYSPVTITRGGSTVQNIHMLRPTIWTTPYINVTLRPVSCGSYSNPSSFIQLINYGDGNMTWNHKIDTPAPWLTLTKPSTTSPVTPPWVLTGSYPFTGGHIELDATQFNLTGLAVGQYTTTVTYTTQAPNVGTVTVPVKLDVIGNPIVAASNVVPTIDQSNGFVNVTFDGPKSSDPLLTGITVNKNGSFFMNVVANSTGKYTFSDVITALPATNVTNTYTVEALYSGGYKTCPAEGSVTLFGPAYTAKSNIAITMLTNTTAQLAFNVANTGIAGSLLYNNIVPASFVTGVTPPFFTIPQGTNKDFMLTFSSVGKAVGTYTVTLTNNTNLGPKFINATMYVTNAHKFAGTVTHGINATPLLGATVTAINIATGQTYTTTTDDFGKYILNGVLAGDYNITFSLLGYQDVVVAKSIAITAAASTVTVDATLWENTNGLVPPTPSCATAAVNATDTQADVAWCLPSGSYELLYDDNSADNFAVWDYAGSMNAVKFRARGPQSTVDGARFFVGNGAFPVGGNFLGKSVDIAVYADDGVNGIPGTMIAKKTVVVNNYGWVTVTGLAAPVTSRYFYIVMIQNSDAPNAVPIGVDETLPTAYMSYSRNMSTGSPWILSPFQDFMIHAIVNGQIDEGDKMEAVAVNNDNDQANNMAKLSPVDGQVLVSDNGLKSMRPAAAVEGTPSMDAQIVVPQDLNNSDAVKTYKLTRYPFDVKTATLGTGVVISSTLTSTAYTDGGTAWSGLAAGWYVYGIKAIYASNPAAQESAEVLTNAVPHKLFTTVTVNVKDGCGAVVPDATVTLTPTDAVNFPVAYYKVLTAKTNASGVATFDNTNAATGAYTLQTNYNMKVSKNNYDNYNFVVNANAAAKSVDVVLDDHRYTPFNLRVDPITLVAKWDTVADIFKEDFENGVTWATSGTPTTNKWTRFHYADWSAGTGYYNYDQYDSQTWNVTDNYATAKFPIPAHTNYVAINVDKAKDVDASIYLLDILRTPLIDITKAPKNTLSFDVFFTGDDVTVGQLRYRTWSGTAWSAWAIMGNIPTATTWQTVKVNLDALSGNGNLPIQFGFLAAYNTLYTEQAGTGMAIDNVKVTSTVNPPLGFAFFLNKSGEVSQVAKNTTTFTINPNLAPYGQNMFAGVSGYYCSGYSYDTINMARTHFVSHFLYPPKNVTATPNVAITQGGADVKWDAPVVTSAPGQPGEVTLQYCSETITSGFSGDGDNGTWRSMIRLNNTKLADFYNKKELTKVMIGLANYDFTKLVVKVYKLAAGADPKTLTEAALIYSQDVTSSVVKGQWNTVTLDHTIAMAGGFDYFVGYEVSAASGKYPSGMMDAQTPYSLNNWVYDNLHGWNSLHDIAAVAGYTMDNYNWALKAVINNGTPANLVGYKVYRDGVALPNLAPTTKFADWGIMPGNHCYTVSAVYDLTAYGLTGTDESTKADPQACVDVNFGFQLPFTENWTHGQDLNMWTGLDNNWIIDGQDGNPNTMDGRPCAKFKWDPTVTNYDKSLESFYIDASVVKTTTPYVVWFEFDLKSDNQNATGKEKLAVEVWDGAKWTAVKSYTAGTDFDWTGVKVDITDLVKGKVFKVRFRATGASSSDIRYWAVDNINIHMVFDLKAVGDLAVTTINKPANDNKLTWTAPSAGVVSYNIYRRPYQVVPAGENTAGTGEWTKLESGITALEYFDMNLSNLTTNCYEYKVTAVYPEGESEASNIGWACIFVSIAPANTNEVKLYPNPATDYVKIELSKPVVTLNVYNSLGAVVAQRNVQGETNITLNTRNFAAGAYSVRFTTQSGESFTRKFVVTK